MSHPARGTGSRTTNLTTTQPPTRGRPLEDFLPPLKVAVIGASPNPRKVGNVLLRNVLRSKGVTSACAVNPGHDVVEGVECHPCLDRVPWSVDLAVVAVPAREVPDVVRQCVHAGVPAVVVVSSGFSEAGDEGRRLEEDLRRALEGGSTRLLGPNALGYILPSQDLDVVFLEEGTFPRPKAGNVGVITQSGSLGVDIMNEVHSCGNGISAFFSLGNKLDVDECDAMEHLAGDDDTRSMLVYLESVSDGGRMLRALRRWAPTKPIVLLQGGKGKNGRRATSLHTGRMGAEHRVLSGVLEQTGVVEARDEVELVDLGRAFCMLPRPRGGRVFVLTNGGGNGILAVDRIDERWKGTLQVASLRPSLVREMEGLMPRYVRPGNPMDLSAEATDDGYVRGLSAVLEADACDVAILGVTANERLGPGLASGIGGLARQHRLPVLAYIKGMEPDDGLWRDLTGQGIPSYPSVRRAVDAAGACVRWHLYDRVRCGGGDVDAA